MTSIRRCLSPDQSGTCRAAISRSRASAGVPKGLAIPHRIGRHSQPKAKPETPATPPQPSGIDYALLIETAYAAELSRGVNYAALSGTGEIPGQPDLLTGEEVQPR